MFGDKYRVLEIPGTFTLLAKAPADWPRRCGNYPVVNTFSLCCHHRLPRLLVLTLEQRADQQTP